MTITPVVAGDTACASAADGRVIEAAPVKARASAKATLRSAFVGLVSAIMAGFPVLGCRELAAGRAAASREPLFAGRDDRLPLILAST
jgi:hypothetical protein